MSAPLKMAACDSCRYYRPGARAADRDGICRRMPPAEWTDRTVKIDEEVSTEEVGPLITLQSELTYTGWPDVCAHDWCGEYASVRVSRPRPRQE